MYYVFMFLVKTFSDVKVFMNVCFLYYVIYFYITGEVFETLKINAMNAVFLCGIKFHDRDAHYS